MSFFGITALGPPNLHKLYKYDRIGAVPKPDFRQAFRMVAGAKGFLTVDDFGAVVGEALNGGFASPDEVEEFKALVDPTRAHHIGPDYFDELLDKMQRIPPPHPPTLTPPPPPVTSDVKPCKEYTSIQELTDHRHRHHRMLADPHEKFRAPVTNNQIYGWGGRAPLGRTLGTNAPLFRHKPSYMSFYSETLAAYEDGRDFVAGPTMKALENNPTY
jgi:hypothetical protein